MDLRVEGWLLLVPSQDGSIKDPKLGLLVRPFHLKGVPSASRMNSRVPSSFPCRFLHLFSLASDRRLFVILLFGGIRRQKG